MTLRHDDSCMIHICGMYKSGTSWLLYMLCSHPQVIGWREFDPILASHRRPISGRWRKLRVLFDVFRGQTLERLPDLRWTPRSQADCLRRFFAGEGWIALEGADRRKSARALLSLPPKEFLDGVLEIAGARLRPDNARHYLAEDMNTTLGYRNCRYADTLALVELLHHAGASQSAPDLLWQLLQHQCEPGVQIAVKSANQELALPLLLRLSPRGRRIAIIRDGRDAALSASHFRRLMTQQDAAAQPRLRGLNVLLLAWACRVEALLTAAARGEILLLRYEDLLDRPDAIFALLLKRLGLDADPALVEAICKANSFEMTSGGRKPGEEALALARRGLAGEWLERLTHSQKHRAWRLIGPTLTRAGYSPSGHALATPSLFLCG